MCDSCQRRASSLTPRICNKAHLYDYIEFFFPRLYSPSRSLKILTHQHASEFVVARREPAAIEQVIKENIAGFTENKIRVEVSSGPAYPVINISVHEFLPKNLDPNHDFLYMYHAPPNVNSPVSHLRRIYAPPFALPDNKDGSKLRDDCHEHIKAMTKHGRFSKDATNGSVAPVSLEVFEAVNKYRKSKRALGNVGRVITHNKARLTLNIGRTRAQGN